MYDQQQSPRRPTVRRCIRPSSAEFGPNYRGACTSRRRECPERLDEDRTRQNPQGEWCQRRPWTQMILDSLFVNLHDGPTRSFQACSRRNGSNSLAVPPYHDWYSSFNDRSCRSSSVLLRCPPTTCPYSSSAHTPRRFRPKTMLHRFN